MSIQIGATLAGFGLIAVGIGWVKSDSGQARIAVRANHGHVDAVNERVSENTEHLIRIETLREERLPERRQRKPSAFGKGAWACQLQIDLPSTASCACR